jgi:endonuclease/exonuclease/phosphatase family metal-dependent hydrolase
MDTHKDSALKIITLNIEGDNHLDKVIDFLQKEHPDVICLQEVLEKDINRLKINLDMDGIYVPFKYIDKPNNARLTPGNKWGALLLSNLKINSPFVEYYEGAQDFLPMHMEGEPNVCNRAILGVKIAKGDTVFQVITTHFTWSRDGETSSIQLSSLDNMLKLLNSKTDFILCGDFNAPRGKEIWGKLAHLYTDNVPSETTSTVDPNLHRVKNIMYVVDGMFSTKAYSVRDASVIEGVSDHKAIVATVEKND